MADDSTFAGGNGNNRVVQPLNDRKLYIAAESGASYISAGLLATAAAIAALAF